MDKFDERDVDRLLGILDHCDRINACIKRFGDDFESFRDDVMYQDAVYMNLFQIGELVHRISEDCLDQISGIPWHRIYGQRNIIAHGYVSLREEEVWETIKNDIPVLFETISRALGQEE